MRPLFNPLIEASSLDSRKLASFGPVRSPVPADEIANMSTNENAFGTAPEVVEAVQQAAAGLWQYPGRMAEQVLREKLAELHGKGLTADNFVLGNSGSEVLQHAADGFLEPGDEVIAFTPTFGYFPQATARCGGKMVWLQLSAENNFTMNVDRVIDAITEQTRIVYLCNPNNPTGNVMNSAEYDRLINAIPEHIMIVSDEAYYQFVTDDNFPDASKHIHAGRNLLQMFTFSKAYGLAGLRLGYGIARPEIAAYLAKEQRTFHVGNLQIAAGMAAIDAQAHVEHSVDQVVRGRNWMVNQLRELDLTVWESEGNFVLFDTGLPSGKVAHALQRKGIMVADGERRFGLPTCIRVTIGSAETNRRFIEELAAFLDGKKT